MSIRRVAVAASVALALALPVTPTAAQPGPDPNRAPAGKKAPPLAPAARDALARALAQGRLSQAEYALHRVRSLFELRRVRREFGAVEAPDGRDATMLFRDLAVRVNELEGGEREAAELLLARPDDSDQDGPIGNSLKYPPGSSQTLCSDLPVKVCVHWVEEGSHAVPAGQQDETMTTLVKVWNDQITEGGFRAPKPDHKPPGPFKEYLDVYLADIGAFEIYGYCTSDDPNLLEGKIGTIAHPYFDISAYCVLDNDYAEDFFGESLLALQVTAAHEFFHAVQFAYDAFEDLWLMEGTATAIEDHVYDDIDDNYQFLKASQLVKPHFPTDLTHEDSEHAFMNRYGAWLFWRFMTERLGDPGMPDMSVLKAVWARADAAELTGGLPDDYSIKAAVNVVKQTPGISFKQMFADHGVALQLPESKLAEGAGYVASLEARNITRKTTHKKIRLRPGAPRARRGVKINHLAHKYVDVFKKKSVASRKVRVILDLPPKKRGARATLLPFTGDGTALQQRRFKLDRRGDGRMTVGPNVRRAIIVLTNASTRYRDCWSVDPRNPSARQVSCLGKPRDNGLKFVLKARLLN